MGYVGDYVCRGLLWGVMKGNTRSVDYGSYECRDRAGGHGREVVGVNGLQLCV